jgi:hypothetical protein
MQIDYVRAYNWISVPQPPPLLKLRMPFDDSPGTTTTSSETNAGGVNVILQMVNGAGSNADYHGATNSGAGGVLNGSRALDFTSNGTSQPGNPGPGTATTNANLGFGIVSNFVATVWIKLNAQMVPGGNVGPRIYVMGAGTPNDTGATNSFGLKFQTANQLYFQIGTFIASASFSTNLPINQWLFLAAVYDGMNLMIYQGTDTNPANLISTTAISGNIDFGAYGALYIGNRQDRQRSFNGWIDDFRFYTGVGDSDFIESVRQFAITPANVIIKTGANGIQLVWPAGILQSATNIAGPWNNLNGATSPYDITPTGPQQFYRAKIQ